MAITHFTPQLISRGEGRSAVAAAAYRHCARMENEREGRVADFSRKPGMVHDEFVLPADAPEWARALVADRSVAGASEAFWNKVEAFETRKDAQLAKEFILALPRELTTEQNVAMMHEFVAEHVSTRGLVADWVYHDAPGNPHVHLMTTLRPLTKEGFGGKKVPVIGDDGQPVRSKSGQIVYKLWAGDKADFLALREAWYGAQNKHLELNGHDIRVDGSSYAERGIDLEPTSHIGVASKNIQRERQAEGREAKLERLALHEETRRENARRIERRPEIVLEVIAREKSVFDERDVARHLHRYVDDPGQFANLMARVMGSSEAVKIEVEGVDLETGERLPERFATRDMIRIEAEMGNQAEHLATNGRFGVSVSARAEVIAGQAQISDEQSIGLERITGDERLAIIVGRAGAGKTTMMKAAREVWEAYGYRVVGGALAGKAAEGLEKEAGIASRTLASWQLQWEHGRLRLDNKTVFVMDEAGMVSSRQMADFVSAVAHAGAKLVLVGDADQLQPIEAGAAFRSLANRVGYAELGTIYRQREQWMRDASMDLARGKIGEAISAYQGQGRLVGMELKDQAVSALVRDWIADYDPNRSSLILAHLRRDVRTLNELARGALLERGLIEQGHAFRTEDGMRNFAPGDQIVFLKNEGSLDVKNGMIGRIVEAESRRFVAEVGDDKRRVEIDQRFYRNVDHGYATTIHKSQGATIDRVKVLATLSLDRHLTYVAMTRHRHDAKLYYGRRSFGRAGGLIQNLSKRGAKDTTLDFAGSKLYQQALSYANSRGLYGARVAKALVENQLRWIREQRDRLETAAARLSSFIARFGRAADRQAAAVAMATTSPVSHAWIRGLATWAQSIPQLVETKLQSDATLTHAWTQLRDRVAQVYEKPDSAVGAMNLPAIMSANEAERQAAQSRIVDQLGRDPEAFGAMRGRTGMFASSDAKAERQRALNNVPALKDNLARYVRLRAEIGDLRTEELSRERDRSRVDIPALSGSAQGVLDRIRDAIDRNDLSAALGFALADKMVKAEIDQLNKVLDQRFGERAFLGSKEAKGPAYDAAAAQVAEGDRSKLVAAWPSFSAAQRIAAYERAVSQTRAQSQVRDQGVTR
ncbi:Ti-type conjugative transfer relaxase TraA [Pelagibacterium luteolum]|uniref:Ti-type conjugative transfer relaxase TraA n=1 Tax=Pelagibacterium luteolum TaxID=440168 RepID=UPI000B88DBB2|nr:Ti-type conjugative transfer relaxase TraA [Pelagibacterium luteolum]